nr:MAG: hypothetical protein OI719_00380 [Candidatus Methanoperedens sp.]
MHIIVKILLVISALLFSAYYIQTYLDGYETRITNVEVPYQVPIYKTLYSGILTYSFLGINIAQPYSLNDATLYETESTNWMYSNVRICHDSECKHYIVNGGFDTVQTHPSQIVIGNETKYQEESRGVTKKRWDWLFS